MIRIVYVKCPPGKDVEVILCPPCFTELKRNLGDTAKSGKVQKDICEHCGVTGV